MAVDLVVKNGTVVTSTGRFRGGIAIDGGVIVAVAGDEGLPSAERTIDATGLYVLPGAINPHVHFREPGLEYKEDFTTGSTAAVMGGICTVVDMPNTKPPTADPDGVMLKRRLIEEKSYCDIGILGVVIQENVDQIPAMDEAGVCGYKIFLGETIGNIPAPDDGMLLDALRLITKTGKRIGFHAENDQIMQHLIRAGEGRRPHRRARSRRLAASDLRGRVDPAHGALRELHGHEDPHLPPELARRARDDRGVAPEGRRHHDRDRRALLLPRRRRGHAAARLGVADEPAVRSAEHGKALFQGLLDGSIEAIGTDHSPHTREEKLNDDIWKAISGFTSVETSLAVFLSMAVRPGDMTLEQLVRVTSEGPAKIWGMYPQKGALQLGSDGDLTIVDLDHTWTIDEEKLHSKNNVTPFNGVEVTGRAVGTIVRGPRRHAGRRARRRAVGPAGHPGCRQAVGGGVMSFGRAAPAVRSGLDQGRIARAAVRANLGGFVSALAARGIGPRALRDRAVRDQRAACPSRHAPRSAASPRERASPTRCCSPTTSTASSRRPTAARSWRRSAAPAPRAARC